MKKTHQVPAMILAGGLGTRLRIIERERPKPMVEVMNKPFLYWLILSLEKIGFGRIIFSVGYKAEYIKNYSWSKFFPNIEFEFVTEMAPLGTGGAVKNIFDLIKDLESVWVINGDTLLENPLAPKSPSTDQVFYAALNPKLIFDAKANLIVDGDRVTGVGEGRGSLFDGGQVYITRGASESYLGDVPCSFHQLVSQSFLDKQVGFIETPGTCYDIGTPDRLKRFETYLKNSFIGR